MTLAYHVWNADGWQRDLAFPEAIGLAQSAIDRARAACNPEWPAYVEEICIVAAPVGTDTETLGDLDAVMTVVQADVRSAPPETRLDTFCDYVLRPCNSKTETFMPDGTPVATPEIIMIVPTTDTTGMAAAPAPPFTANPQTTAMIAAGLLIVLLVALCVPLQSWAAMSVCHNEGGTVIAKSPFSMACLPGETREALSDGH